MNTEKNIVESALQAANKPFLIDIAGTPVLMLPGSDGGWNYDELTRYRWEPLRKTGSVVLHQLDSLLAFVKEHKEGGTQLIVDADYGQGRTQFRAVINGHTGAEPGFCDFTALYAPLKTVDWSNWLASNGKKMGQEEFARFLQDNIANIASQNPADTSRQYPAAAALLEFASNLEMTSTVRFRSSTRVQNGQVQFEFVEEGDNNTKGRLEMFERFGLGLQPFAGGDAYFIEAFLRFRIDRNSGELKLWYDLNRPDKALESATEKMIERIKAESGVPVYFGKV
ncbi:DUF2303 family protein [Microvirgula aerodenitrificans]|uniref:DUF2303 family protein n=1 Tax=Microvirgula aerodenitrificans TaxID=57480 RepID=UPI000491975E|nr:DUF2303 family protein [Microvirgula aerodenitrificans]